MFQVLLCPCRSKTYGWQVNIGIPLSTEYYLIALRSSVDHKMRYTSRPYSDYITLLYYIGQAAEAGAQLYVSVADDQE